MLQMLRNVMKNSNMIDENSLEKVVILTDSGTVRGQRSVRQGRRVQVLRLAGEERVEA